ncbi:MAG TPA: PDZ domain-containing protein [Pyrinomonadaceae bacterium]|nr:PDZ domain-containing protein [Pyrinomonadaceae bacterium]
MPRTHFLLALFLLILFSLPVVADPVAPAVQSNAPNVTFTVSMSKPWTHLLEVEMKVRQRQPRPTTDVIMPVWTPGSYLIREYARHVQEFAAFDANNRGLNWIKTNKNTWRVSTRGVREFRVTYKVYANELTVRTNELNSDHAFWNNAALLMYPAGALNQPSILHIIPYGDWKIATGLPSTGEPLSGRQWAFRAANFDTLYDSPVEVGNFKQIDFQVRGVPHRIVIDGEAKYDPDRLRNEVQKIVEKQVAIFDDVPYRDYTFILHLRADARGGLEHSNSTSLGFRHTGFAAEAGYKSFASLVAHEFFHLWNVKRIRPDVLGPFDYTKENHTRLLWVAEGVTEYFGNLTLRRTGAITEEAYLEQIAESIQKLEQTPGRLLVSVEEASFDAWIKEYRPDENTINSTISYYDKGDVLGFLLDLEIRRRSGGARSLDDVMRSLYRNFFLKNRNYTPADFQRTCEQAAGGSLEDFFSRYVRGREELPYNQILAGAGLSLRQAGIEVEQLRNNIPAGVPVKAYLGAEVMDYGQGLLVTSVRRGTPAYDQGLNADDVIVEVDGQRLNKQKFDARLAEKKPGDSLKLNVIRFFDRPKSFDIKLGSRITGPYQIVRRADATEIQKKIYQGWMGTNQ